MSAVIDTPVKEVKAIIALIVLAIVLVMIGYIYWRMKKADDAIAKNAQQATRIDTLDRRLNAYDAAMQDRNANAATVHDFTTGQQAIHKELHDAMPTVRSWDDAAIPGELRARSAAARRQRAEARCVALAVRGAGGDKAAGGCGDQR